MLCCIKGCGGEVDNKKRELCQKHYFRWRRNGTTELKRPPKEPSQTAEDIKKVKCLARYGCTLEELRDCRANGLLCAFQTQRKNAAHRGIDWQLNLSQWLGIWRESGKLSDRGLGRGKYVMSRSQDKGPYAVGNVSIKLGTENNAEGFRRSAAAGPKPNKGVYRLHQGTAKPWAAKYSKTWLGFYATEAEAVDARIAFMAKSGIARTRHFDA